MAGFGRKMTLTDMSLRDMDRDLYGGRVFECAQWLVENQGWNESRKVWGYGDKVPGIGEAKKTADPVLGNRRRAAGGCSLRFDYHAGRVLG